MRTIQKYMYIHYIELNGTFSGYFRSIHPKTEQLIDKVQCDFVVCKEYMDEYSSNTNAKYATRFEFIEINIFQESLMAD